MIFQASMIMFHVNLPECIHFDFLRVDPPWCHHMFPTNDGMPSWIHVIVCLLECGVILLRSDQNNWVVVSNICCFYPHLEKSSMWLISFNWVGKQSGRQKKDKLWNGKIITLHETNIFHLGNRKIIFKMPFLVDMLVPWRVYIIIWDFQCVASKISHKWWVLRVARCRRTFCGWKNSPTPNFRTMCSLWQEHVIIYGSCFVCMSWFHLWYMCIYIYTYVQVTM